MKESEKKPAQSYSLFPLSTILTSDLQSGKVDDRLDLWDSQVTIEVPEHQPSQGDESSGQSTGIPIDVQVPPVASESRTTSGGAVLQLVADKGNLATNESESEEGWIKKVQHLIISINRHQSHPINLHHRRCGSHCNLREQSSVLYLRLCSQYQKKRNTRPSSMRLFSAQNVQTLEFTFTESGKPSLPISRV